MTHSILPLVVFFTLTAAQADPVSRPQMIYGTDDRIEAYDVSDPGVRRVLDGIAAIVPANLISKDPDGTEVFRNTATFGAERELCANERFADQPANAICTAFLVAPDIIATAGHCGTPTFCLGTRIVFGNEMRDARTPPTRIPPENIYRCERVLAQTLSLEVDYALMKLDRPVTGREPLRLATAPPKVHDALYIAGFPGEVPLKVAGHAGVRSVTETNFVSDVDSFGGNSGSPVLSLATNEVVGVISRGATDYVYDPLNRCYVANKCAQDECSGETSTFAAPVARALEALANERRSLEGQAPSTDEAPRNR